MQTIILHLFMISGLIAGGGGGGGGVGQSQYVGGRLGLLGRKNACDVTSAKRAVHVQPWLHPLSPTCMSGTGSGYATSRD